MSETAPFSPAETADVVADVDGFVLPRPTKRSDCEGGERPCPFVGCKYNLYLDVSSSGKIRISHPNIAPEQVDPAQSCALDVADDGESSTLDRVAKISRVTRERVRQIEVKALRRLRLVTPEDMAPPPSRARREVEAVSESAPESVEPEPTRPSEDPKEQKTMATTRNQRAYSDEQMLAFKQVVEGAPPEGIDVSEFSEKTGLAPVKRARYVIDRLVDRGEIRRVKRGRWGALGSEAAAAAPAKKKSAKKKKRVAAQNHLQSDLERLRASRARIVQDAVRRAGVEEDLKKIDRAIAAIGG